MICLAQLRANDDTRYHSPTIALRLGFRPTNGTQYLPKQTNSGVLPPSPLVTIWVAYWGISEILPRIIVSILAGVHLRGLKLSRFNLQWQEPYATMRSPKVFSILYDISLFSPIGLQT